ncbi:NAD(P)/FAD-dependent oxidoreductase [Sansalvadorimonas verongulae]|uniref:NAD(P)/FAD-dependent oxidoreductase n=1 Tax=Sansalvadorimonas verongulae TaxID=2172824 RepID=UPI0012BBB6FD|nr:FAD-dependent oxidoreductase [Sansalvadorimonas verongulae]MTI13511.1 NAD(P)/FAD-dependent oxidoreductase [Sansalvadorimonas verongulae]
MAKLLVIGNGMACVRCLEHLIENRNHGYDITVLSAEPVPGYNRIMLSPLLAGELDATGTRLRSASWYADNGIQLHCGEAGRAVMIDRSLQQVEAADGSLYAYDKLVLATGSRPFIPEIPGCNYEGVLGFRTLNDVETMLSVVSKGRQAVIVGGGLLGLEAACALQAQGMHTTVVHSRAVLMNRQMDATAGELLHRSLTDKGVEFRLLSKMLSLTGHNNRVSGVVLASGEVLTADLVVLTAGIHPNIELVQSAGLRCNRGLLVNSCLQSEDPRIFGLGECVEVSGHTFGLVEPVYQQARILADVLCGTPVSGFQPSDTATRLKVTGIDLFSLGDFEGGTPDQSEYGNDELVLNMPSQGIYRKLVIRNHRLQGVLLYGDISDALWYQELFELQQDISEFRDMMIFGRSYTEPDAA